MADIKEAIRRLIYEYVTTGADKVVTTQEAIAASTAKTDKASLSLEKSFNSLERRYVETVRAQQDYQKVQERVNAAVAQNPALQERANAVLAAATQRYGQATAAQNAFAVATSGVSAQLTAMSAGAGPVGVFLSALGPWGIAASVGLGALSAVFNRLIEGAERIGDKSIELRKFSDVTGLTVTQIKGLTQAGGRLGIDAEEIKTSLERFSVGLNEARKGTGSLFDQVREINPELAKQLAGSTNAARGWDILAKALQGATEASQRNALARAAFGRGGIETSLVAVESAAKGGIDAMAKGISLTQDWVTETARLRAENVQLEKATQAAMDAAFALPVLQRQNEYLKTQKEIADLWLKGGGLKAPGAEDYGAAFVAYATPPTTGGGRGPSEGAMQAQEEAKIQREILGTLEQQTISNTALMNLEKERIGYLGAAATEQERINLKTMELNDLLARNIISQDTYNRALEAASNMKQSPVDYQTTAYEKSQGVISTYKESVDDASDATEGLNKQTEGLTSTLGSAAPVIYGFGRAWGNYMDYAQEYQRRLAQQEQGVRNLEASMKDAAIAADNLLRAMLEFVPTIAVALGSVDKLFKSNQGGYSQFNPAGYTSTIGWAPLPYAQQLEETFNRSIAGGGFNASASGLASTISATIASGFMTGSNKNYGEGGPPGFDTDKYGLVTRAIGSLPEAQQAAPLQQLLKQLQATTPSLETTEAINSLNQRLEQLTSATEANTDATQSMTDVLSPYYSSDPRRTHLGFRAFAGGGIMTAHGELPLRHYQGGGMATSPQVAVFGEGSTPEAYVPVPSGRIPVEIKQAANSNRRPINVTINVHGNADAGTVAALKSTAFQQAQAMRRVMG